MMCLCVIRPAGAVLHPWDQEFYTRQLAATKPHMQAAAAAAPYLQLGSVLSGLDQLLQQLMGLRLQQQPLSAGEGWAPGVLKLAVSCEELGPLGVLYLDLLVRPGKVGASGILYPLRCGRALPGEAMWQTLVGLSCCCEGCEGSATTCTPLCPAACVAGHYVCVIRCGHAEGCRLSAWLAASLLSMIGPG